MVSSNESDKMTVSNFLLAVNANI